MSDDFNVNLVVARSVLAKFQRLSDDQRLDTLAFVARAVTDGQFHQEKRCLSSLKKGLQCVKREGHLDEHEDYFDHRWPREDTDA